MKKILLITLIALIGLTSACFAQEFAGKDVAIVVQDIDTAKIQTIEFRPLEKEAIVRIVYGYYVDGEFIQVDKHKEVAVRDAQYTWLINQLTITGTNVGTIIQAVIDHE